MSRDGFIDATRHPRAVITFGCATIGAAVLALVLFA